MNFESLMVGWVAGIVLPGLFTLHVIASALRGRPRYSKGGDTISAVQHAARSIFFLSVVADSMTTTFLPVIMIEAATREGLSALYASASFMLYYAAFAFILLPGGILLSRYGPKPIFLLGGLLIATAVLIPALHLTATALTVNRLLSGIGQGFVLIAIQAFVMGGTSTEGRLRGANIIVYCFNGGMVVGLSAGSWIQGLAGVEGAFLASCASATTMLAAGLVSLPRTAPTAGVATVPALTLVRNLGRCIVHPGFAWAALTIGIPAKAVMTGVVLYALPVMLAGSESGVGSGRIVAFYALGVIAAGMLPKGAADGRSTGHSLIFGGALSGISLLLAPLVDLTPEGPSWISMAAYIALATALGLAHGFINGPVVIHVSASSGIKGLDPLHVASAYRFLERAGHLAGPLAVAALMGLAPGWAWPFGLMGALVAILTCVFGLTDGRGASRKDQVGG